MRTMGYMPTEMELIELSQQVNMNSMFLRSYNETSSAILALVQILFIWLNREFSQK